MNRTIAESAEEACASAAAFIADRLGKAIEQRGTASIALSGGGTPVPMFDALSVTSLSWDRVHLFQTDERFAPTGSTDRNLSWIEDHLVSRLAVPPAGVHAMPVDDDADDAATRYAAVLERFAGKPPVIDVVHLGLGADGHTASLVPGDPVLGVVDADVATTGTYRGHRRLTLTFPVIARARCVVWLVTGMTKADALGRLVTGDAAMPAGRVARERASLFADRAAAFLFEPPESA